MIKKVDFEKLQNSSLIESKFYSHYLNPNSIDFRKEYYKDSKFLNYSVEVKNSNCQYFLPITVQLKKNKRYLNFFGLPITILSSKKLIYQNYFDILNYLNSLDKEFKFDEINLKIEIEKKHFQEIKKERYFENFSHEIFIDLQVSKEKIYENFQSNLKGLLKKIYPDIYIDVINKNNHTKQDIKEFRNLHFKVSGRFTRSVKTWEIQDKKIKNSEAFIVRIRKNNETISLSYFSVINKNVYYDVGVALREFYGQYKNIHHKSLWKAIQYAKSINCKSFFVGSFLEESKKEIDTKVKNIQMFKKRFTKPNFYHTLIGINKVPEVSEFTKYIRS